jgi:arginyl-tRNA synthetase
MLSKIFNEKHKTTDDKLTLGAIKYAFLKSGIGSDIVFDPDESISLQGNSGPYLQYSLTRAKSILRAVKSNYKNVAVKNDQLDTHERTLLVKITEIKDVLHKATVELSPHLICTYLYELAQVFNRFYENSRVAGGDREVLRAQLVYAYSLVLESGLDILGIKSPEKM